MLVLMLLWERMMGQKCVNLLTSICYIYLIRKKYNSKNIGLYRDDGLAVLRNVSGPAPEKIKTFTIFCVSKKTCK